MPSYPAKVGFAISIIKDLLEKDEKLQDRTSLNFWGFVCIILTSPFKINSMSRLKEWLWGLGYVP